MMIALIKKTSLGSSNDFFQSKNFFFPLNCEIKIKDAKSNKKYYFNQYFVLLKRVQYKKRQAIMQI